MKPPVRMKTQQKKGTSQNNCHH